MQNKEKSLKDQYIESQQRAFIREVNEDVRTEKAILFWNKYKYYIIGIIVLILAITISKNVYESNKKETSLKQAVAFERIMSNKTSSADKIKELEEFVKSAKYGYRDIAYFNIYSMQLESGDIASAIDTLKTIIKKATDSSFKDLAILKLATLNFAQNDITDSQKTEIIKLLSKISASKPFYFSAQFVLGVIYISQNNPNLAKTTFDRIVENEKTPIGLKSQSLNMLNFLKSQTAK
ncbi:tetratricopeptide repeat protein [bacterium]|nr:tetratricopeptide repeat protein [bacterium]